MSARPASRLEVCGELLDQFPDGAWLVDLAGLSDPKLVATVTASALGVREQPPRSITETLVDHLIPRGALVLLDNCEHLIDACAEFAEHLLRSGPSQPATLAPEEDNLRAALAWAVDTGDEVSALRIAGSAWFGNFDERRRLYARILPPSTAVPPDIAAKALFGGVGLAFMTADWARGVELATSGEAAAQAAGDGTRLAMCLTYHGLCLWGLGDLPAGLELVKQGLAWSETAQYREGEARSLMGLAWMWSELDLDRAEEAAVRGVQLSGLDVFESGHLGEALGFIHCLRGDHDRAGDRLGSAALLFKGIQRNCGAHMLKTCAAWAAMTERYELGAEFVGAAQRQRDETGDQPRPWERRVREEWLPRIDAALDPTTGSAARRARGRARVFEDALEFAASALRQHPQSSDPLPPH